MSGQVPFFITGANCKIRINGVTMAYATDLAYSVQINYQQAKVCGMYEADTLEPVGYSITGQFTVIKYIDSMKSIIERVGFKPPSGVANQGNGIGSMTAASGAGRALGVLGGDVTGGRAYDALDPSKLGRITGFDIEIYQKVPKLGGPITIARALEGAARDVTGFITGNPTQNGDILGIARLRDCHITGLTTQISKRGLMTQTYTFMANYLDEDSFLSSSSDSGQRIV